MDFLQNKFPSKEKVTKFCLLPFLSEKHFLSDFFVFMFSICFNIGRPAASNFNAEVFFDVYAFKFFILFEKVSKFWGKIHSNSVKTVKF